MTKPTFRRLLAYFFDSLIVVLVSTAFSSINFLNPNMDKYEEVYSEYNDYLVEVSGYPTAVNQLFNDEKMATISYDMAYYGKNVSIISFVITFLYFVVFQFITKGKTAGKLIMGIEVIPDKGEKLKFSQVLIRSAIINSLFTSLLLIIAILVMNKGGFFKATMAIQLIDMALVFVCCGMIIYKENGVGLHDKLAHTMVIKSSEKEEILKNRNNIKKSKKEDE